MDNTDANSVDSSVQADEADHIATNSQQFQLRDGDTCLDFMSSLKLPALICEADGQILSANEQLANLLSRHQRSVKNRHLHEFLSVPSGERLTVWFDKMLDSPLATEGEAFCFGGNRLAVQIQVRQPEILGQGRYLILVEDGSHRENALEKLLQSEQRLSCAADLFSLCIFDWDLKSGQTHYRGAWKECTKASPSKNKAQDIHWLLDLLHAEDHGMVFMEFTALRKESKRHFEAEVRLEGEKMEERWFRIRAHSLPDEHGKPGHIIGALQDITDFKSTELQAARFVQQDSLTGLPNRQQLLNRMHSIMDRKSRKEKARFALIVIDVDRFRFVNESLGHDLGDTILQILADRIQNRIRQSDLVARLSGDQFAVLAWDLSAGSAVQSRIDRIRQRISETVHVTDEIPVNLDINVGIRYWQAGEMVSAEEVLRDASVALHHAKEGMNTRVVEYFPELQQRMFNTVRFESDIREAIRDGGVEVHYQPIVDAESGRPVSLEALARVRHASRGLIPPSDFIPIAEETGLITELSREVIRQATQQLAQWRKDHPDLPDLTIAVNLSPAQFDGTGLVSDLTNALLESGLQGADIKVEITESLMMEDQEQAIQILQDMKDMGVHICIDDFGTGFSSLSYIRSFNFDTLKVDRSFIRRITEDQRDAEMIRTIIQLGQNTGMNIVVEGVESDDQRDLLIALGAHHMQGFLISRPLPTTEISNWLERWKAA